MPGLNHPLRRSAGKRCTNAGLLLDPAQMIEQKISLGEYPLPIHNERWLAM